MTWLFYALSAVFFFTCLNILQRVLSVDSKYPRAMAIVFNSIAAIFALALFMLSGSYTHIVLPSEKEAWIYLLIASFFYALFERGRFLASKLLDASLVTTIMNISVLVAFTGSLFLFSEKLTLPKLIGALLIFISLILVSIFRKNKEKASKKGIIVTILISIALGLAWMLDKKGTTYFPALTYSIFIWTIPIIFIYLPYVKINELKAELKRTNWKIALLAFFNVAGYALQLKAFSLTEATKVIPIIQTSGMFTILFGILLLKEKDHLLRKIIAGILAVTGVYFLM